MHVRTSTPVNEFRRVHREHFGALFVEVLKLCRRAGLVKLRHVATDGTKVKANAKQTQGDELPAPCSQRSAGCEREVADASEDARYGAGTRGEELPEELRRRESRLERIREAKAALEAEALKTRAHTLREQAERHERTARSHPEAVVRRRARTHAAKRRAKLKVFDYKDQSRRGKLSPCPVRSTGDTFGGRCGPRDPSQS